MTTGDEKCDLQKLQKKKAQICQGNQKKKGGLKNELA